MMMRRMSLLLGLIVLLVVAGVWTNEARAQEPVVYAVMFYSPSCSHCHYVITEFLPPLLEKHGEQLQILYIDVSQSGGSALFSAACEAFSSPGDRCGYVPTLIIGETMLVGSGDIPARLPKMVEDGLASGGIDLPAISGLRELYDAAIAGESASEETESAPPSDVSIEYTEPTWRDRFNQDPLGNGLSVAVLGVLAIGLGAQVIRGAQVLSGEKPHRGKTGDRAQIAALVLAAGAAIIAGTLALEGGGLNLPTVLAAVVALGLAAVAVAIARAPRGSRRHNPALPTWLIPAIAVLGLIVAGYLAFVEVSENEAVCGAVGDCNTVQQSTYAKLFGVLPIGVLGVIGYLFILSAWGFSRNADARIADWGSAALLGFALFGVAFSAYLTFLEPFVIGATCAWCLTSAMLMILLLCLHTTDGWNAVRRLREGAGSAPRVGSQRAA
ncbi:MAG: vitamin K epoxide reductase [Chloroflexi bacterium]|nr:vitamin K epoxide reductase [Chloroflexota bacterium]